MSTPKLFDLTGKAAIITGSSYGIGLHMAEGLAEAGASVVVCARHLDGCEKAAKRLDQLGGKALPVQCDVTDIGQVETLVRSTLQAFGRVDILVNNAGAAGARSAPEETSLDDWNRVINTDLTSLLVCVKAVAPQMKRQKSGKIINISSVFGQKGSDLVDDIAYHASKGGVENFTRALALKWAKHGINVNAIAPGFFPSPMTNQLLEEVGESVARLTPVGRLGRATDLKGAVVFLASSASDFVTGHILNVDGGWLIRGSGIRRAGIS